MAQVVGASYSMSKKTGDVAMIVRPLRVAMLLPVILIITLSYRKHHVAGPSGASMPPLVPWFVAAFALLVASMVIARRRGVREPAYLEFGLLMVLIPLISPPGWDYVLLVGTPAVMLLVDRWRGISGLWRTVSAFALFGIGFTIYDVLGRQLYFCTMRVSLLTICATLLVASLAHLRWRRLA